MNRTIVNDLKKQLLTDLEELVRRRLSQAGAVLDGGECAILFLEAAAGLVSVAQLYTVCRSREDIDLSVVFDVTEASAVDLIRKGKATVVSHAEIVRSAAGICRRERSKEAQ